MLAQDSGNEEAKAFHHVGHRGHRIGTRLASAAKQVAGKCGFKPSGVKTPEENAAFMSCLKARPTKLRSFSAACKAEFKKSLASAGLKAGLEKFRRAPSRRGAKAGTMATARR